MRKPKRAAKLRRAVLVVFLSPFLVASASFAQERIHKYESEITVTNDGTAHVIDTIEVRAEGNAIRRGIFRDVLTKRGQIVTFIGAKRDGDIDGTRTENRGDSIRLYVGKADHVLSPGDYTYVLTYSVTNVVRRQDEQDQLHWNITGNGWAFPIDKASAVVMFDADVPVNEITVAGYTGKYGEKGDAYRVTNEGVGSVRIEATQSLPPGYGITITAGIPTGYFDLQAVPAPAPFRRLPRRVPNTYPEPSPPRQVAWSGLTAAAVTSLAYFLIIWVFVGRDPLRGRIPSSYDPPSDISPAAARYLTNRGYDSKTFAAAILRMANQGHLSLKHEDDVYEINLVDEDRADLSHDEKVLSKALDIANKDALTTSPNHAIRLLAAAKVHAEYLEDMYRGSHFTLNRIWWFSGCVVALATVIGVFAYNDYAGSGGAALFGALLVVSSGFFLHGAALIVEATRGRVAYSSKHILTRHALGAGVLFLLAASVISVILAALLTEYTHIAFAFVSIGVGFLCWLFYILMPAPTRTGRKALDKIEAFRHTLVDEQGRSRISVTNAEAPAYFDQRFAYAVALDATDEWAGLFNNALGTSEDGNCEVPSWFEDEEMEDVDNIPLYLARHIGSDFPSAIGRVQLPQSSDFSDGDGFGSGGTGSSGISGFGGFGSGGFGGGGFGGGGFGGGGFGGGGGGFSGGGSGGGGGGGW